MRRLLVAALAGAAVWCAPASAAVQFTLTGMGSFMTTSGINAAPFTITGQCSAIETCLPVFGDNGTSFVLNGNFSDGFVRQELAASGLLITPTATPYDGVTRGVTGTMSFYLMASSLYAVRGNGVLQTLTVTTVPGTAYSVPALTIGAPEPATWAMLIAGFALAGGALRRRRHAALAA